MTASLVVARAHFLRATMQSIVVRQGEGIMQSRGEVGISMDPGKRNFCQGGVQVHKQQCELGLAMRMRNMPNMRIMRIMRICRIC